MQDVSEQLRLLGSAVTASGQGIAILSPAVETEGVGPRVQFVNDSFCAMYGLMREEAIGQTPLIFGIIEQQQSILSSMLQHIYDRQPFEAEVTARRRSGSEFELELQLVPVEDAGQIAHWVVYLHDVTASRKQVVQLRHQTMHDTLTELPNRVLLMERFDKAVDAARQSSSRVALLLMDLDRFKDVNDTFGHQFGDVLLKQVAFRLRNQIAPSDFVARLGGDEFAVLVAGAENDSELVTKARRF